LVQHYRETELVDNGDEGKAYSTRDRYDSCLSHWITPRWGNYRLNDVKTIAVEQWLRKIERANATKARIRNLMSALFNHAIRWEFTDRNPITGPVRGSGVRQSSKRERIPEILEVEEMRSLLSELALRERVLVFLDMATGLRRGELAGLQWKDVDFQNLLLLVERSVVDQVVGKCKTEASKKPVPLDEYLVQDLLEWYRNAPCTRPEDWIFVLGDAVLHSACGSSGRHHEEIVLAYVSAHLLHAAQGEWGRRQNGTGASPSCFNKDHVGCLYAGGDPG
jgi:integrase